MMAKSRLKPSTTWRALGSLPPTISNLRGLRLSSLLSCTFVSQNEIKFQLPAAGKSQSHHCQGQYLCHLNVRRRTSHGVFSAHNSSVSGSNFSSACTCQSPPRATMANVTQIPSYRVDAQLRRRKILASYAVEAERDCVWNNWWDYAQA